MTNIEYIRTLDEHKLAELLIQCGHEEEIDYDWDENPYSAVIRESFRTSDGELFDEYSYEDAVEHEIWWLQQNRKSVMEQNR